MPLVAINSYRMLTITSSSDKSKFLTISADPKVVILIIELVAAIGQAEKVDKLLNKPPLEGGMYKGE